MPLYGSTYTYFNYIILCQLGVMLVVLVLRNKHAHLFTVFTFYFS